MDILNELKLMELYLESWKLRVCGGGGVITFKDWGRNLILSTCFYWALSGVIYFPIS